MTPAAPVQMEINNQKKGRPQKTSNPKSEAQRGSETILIADDEKVLRELAGELLEGLGYSVLLASDGEEAVLAFEAAEGSIDLVILDLIMPVVDGLAAYKQIHSFGRKVPVIFMTGYGAGTPETDLLEKEGAVLIAKPYEIDELGRRVREVLDRAKRDE